MSTAVTKMDGLLGALMLSIAIGMVVFCLAQVNADQEPAAFADRDRVVTFLNSRPYAARGIMERVCNQKKLDDIEALMFPAATVAEKIQKLKRAKRSVKRADYGDDDPIVVQIDVELEYLGTEGEQEPEPNTPVMPAIP